MNTLYVVQLYNVQLVHVNKIEHLPFTKRVAAVVSSI